MGEFVTVEQRNFLTKVAERYRLLRAAPELAKVHDVVILNRLHAEGFDLSLERLREALAYADQISEGSGGTLPTKAAAEYLGISETQFKVWFMAGKKSGVEPPPVGTPVPDRVGERGVGKAALWSVSSLDAVKTFLASHS